MWATFMRISPLRRGRRRGLGGARQHLGDLLVVREAAADVGEALARRRVVGLRAGRRSARAGEGARVVAHALVEEHAGAAEQAAALGLVGRALAADLEHAHELAHLVAGLVHVLEHARGAQAQIADLEQALDELARLGVGLADAEHVLEVAERLLGHEQPIDVDAAERELDVDDLVAARPPSRGGARGASRDPSIDPRARRASRARRGPPRTAGRARGCARSSRWPSPDRR